MEEELGKGSDWCIIIIAGNDLTDFLSEKSKRKYLSEEAQKQIEISEELANESQSESKVLKAMEDLIRPCLNRDVMRGSRITNKKWRKSKLYLL